MTSPSGSSSVYQRLRDDLRQAMVERDRVSVSVLRTAISAVENAQAVPDDSSYEFVGVSPDVPRRDLGHGEVVRILEREMAERREAMAVLAASERKAEAATLQAEIDILAAYMDGAEPL